MAVIFASSLLAKLLPRSLFGERCSRGKLVESRVEREVLAPSQAVQTPVFGGTRLHGLPSRGLCRAPSWLRILCVELRGRAGQVLPLGGAPI